MTQTPDTGGYPSPGSIQDINSHPEMNLPEPGYSPNMKHSLEMAGDVLPFPSSKSDPAPTNTSVKNDIGRRNGGGGSNVKKIY